MPAWTPLVRVTGWFESLAVTGRGADAHVVVLVSHFAAAQDAERAYEVILPRTSNVVALGFGSRFAEWQNNAGIGSGPSGATSRWAGFTTFLQSGPMVAEIRVDESVTLRSGPSSQVPNPGRAIAWRVMHISQH